MHLIDTHTHYTHRSFAEDRHLLLQGLTAAGVRKVLNAAIDFASNEEMLHLAKLYPWMYTAVGIHPKYAALAEEWQFRAIEEMLVSGQETEGAEDSEYRRIVAVGETGLDYHWGEETKAVQKYWFHRFIDLAAKYDKPLVIHTRMATADTLEVLRVHALPTRPGVIHCFDGDYEAALAFIELGFKLGVGGAFTKDAPESVRREALSRVPQDAILLETDCPFLMPVGCAGQVNDSSNLLVVLRELALLRGESEEELAEAIWMNTLACFPEMGEKP